MTIPVIGFGKDAGVRIDLPTLLERRLLIQAASGGGKSTLMRGFIEQLSGRVQQWVIDREGDFVTLREAGDFVLVGRGGDVPADQKSVKLLARRLLELGASAVFDLSELRMHEQREYVKLLFEELTHMPRSLWHPLMVWLDEGHFFAPQTEKCVSTQAVADGASVWRKRGYCLCVATQRLSKLDKDVAAELHNKLIGFTDDVDIKRAGDQLGMTTEQRSELQQLDPGVFYALGPAISRTRVLVHAPATVTSPPPKGEARATPPAPPEKVRAMLGKLADLAKESEEELRTAEDLRRGLAERDRRIRQLEKGGAERVVEKPVVDQVAIAAAVEAARARWTRELRQIMAKDLTQLNRTVDGVVTASNQLSARAQEAVAACLALDTDLGTSTPTSAPAPVASTLVKRKASAPSKRRSDPTAVAPSAEGITNTQQRMLNAIATYEAIGATPTREAVAGFCGLSPTSGSYSNNLSALRTRGLIEDVGSRQLATTDAGCAAAEPRDAPTLDEVHEMWFSKVTGTQANILRLVVSSHPKPLGRSEIADALGLSASSGSFSNNLSKLRTLGLIYNATSQELGATDVLFPEGLN